VSTVASPRLAHFARPEAGTAPVPSPAEEERCELCGAPLPAEHRHVADVRQRSLLCACRACAVLLGRPGAGGRHFHLVPERRRLLRDFRLDDALWASLQLPVELAFFFRSTAVERVVALYPSPVGATESQLELEAWAEIARANPVLADLEPDVEALLVNRTRTGGESGEHFLVPIDDCYALVALIRSCWKGLAGGTEVWQEIERFFAVLRKRAEEVR
jgi:Family of unknown function (DUF5947)